MNSKKHCEQKNKCAVFSVVKITQHPLNIHIHIHVQMALMFSGLDTGCESDFSSVLWFGFAATILFKHDFCRECSC